MTLIGGIQHLRDPIWQSWNRTDDVGSTTRLFQKVNPNAPPCMIIDYRLHKGPGCEDLLGFLQQVGWYGAQNPFHHGQVLLAVMGLKRSREKGQSTLDLKGVATHTIVRRGGRLGSLYRPLATWKRVSPR